MGTTKYHAASLTLDGGRLGFLNQRLKAGCEPAKEGCKLEHAIHGPPHIRMPEMSHGD